ncbi:hypothetical protein E8L99_10590 [Phreatobacter aquaticus]|uniref:Acyl dehydratase n=1 Tax=Phreatobacter aquaticus TaxID=2570229 RepID=A0A4D7QLB0_9HYPH|nr:hypothetical protein [Phreatobacter aquaticus]QCK86166.1 hypothetical protein E8L99_10590 [Phreatobacter aquaticus]
MSQVGGVAHLAIEVIAQADQVQAFAMAVGQSGEDARLPTTFPIRWLTDPRIIALIAGLASDRPSALPVHELQTITSIKSLPIGLPLTIQVEGRRTDDIHVTIDATVEDQSGEPVAILHSLLRLMA